MPVRFQNPAMEHMTAFQPGSEIMHGTQTLHGNADSRRHQNRAADCYARKIPKPSVIPNDRATSYTTRFRNKVLVLTLPPVSKRTSEKQKYLSLSKS